MDGHTLSLCTCRKLQNLTGLNFDCLPKDFKISFIKILCYMVYGLLLHLHSSKFDGYFGIRVRITSDNFKNPA